MVPRIIREYKLKYPDVNFIPHATHTALLLARLRAEQIDAAFIWQPVDPADDLSIEPLVKEDGVIAVPAEHRLSNSAAVPMAALAKESFVFLPRVIHPNAHDIIMMACLRAGFTPTIAQEAPDLMSLLPLVAAGFGVAIVPQFLSGILVDGMRYLRIEGDGPRMNISLACRRHDRSRAVQNFMATARRVTQAALKSEAYEAAI